MKISNKFPIVIKESSNIFFEKDQVNFLFGGGNILSRKHVYKSHDIILSSKKMLSSLLKIKKNKKKFKNFTWVITYNIPVKKLSKNFKKKDRKNNKFVGANAGTIHFLEIASNWPNSKQLDVCSDLFLTSKKFKNYPHGNGIEIIINATKILNNLKNIRFNMGYLKYGWLKTNNYQDRYIQEQLGNYEWFTSKIDIKNLLLNSKTPFDVTKKDIQIHGDNLMKVLKRSYARDVKGKDHGVDLKDLLYLRKKIDSKIKFTFYKLDKVEKKILRKYKII